VQASAPCHVVTAAASRTWLMCKCNMNDLTRVKAALQIRL